jgi:hypothetical protein
MLSTSSLRVPVGVSREVEEEERKGESEVRASRGGGRP